MTVMYIHESLISITAAVWLNPQDTCIAFQLDANIGAVGSDSGVPFPDISKSVTCVGFQ